MTTAFVDTTVNLNDDPLSLTELSFDEVKYDEAKEIYTNLRTMTDEYILVNDIDSWKEYENFMINSHIDEIIKKVGIVDIYWHPELNRHFAIQKGMIPNFNGDCAGMGCEYGCCDVILCFNKTGTIIVYRCCDCIDE